MNRFLFLIIILSIVSCANPSKRDSLYWADATLIALDGVSTSRALRSDDQAVETGYVPVRLIGRRPSDAKIFAYTIFHLGILESSRYWYSPMRGSFQWGLLITRPGVVYSNFQIAFD